MVQFEPGRRRGRQTRDIETETGKIDSDSLCTPPEILEPVRELFHGEIDCDPCSNEHSIVGALTTYTWGGLVRPWGGKGVGRGKGRTWQNHPYSTNEPWAAKAIYEMKIGNVRELVILCMTATSTAWWQQLMTLPKRNPRVICTKRIPFLGPDGVPLASSCRFDPALIYYGARERVFDKLFRHMARWSTRGRS